MTDDMERVLRDFAQAQSIGVADTAGHFGDTQITVHKATAYLPVSDELAMDYGLIPDTRPRPPLVTRLRARGRSKIEIVRERLARRVYALISGDELPELDPWQDDE